MGGRLERVRASYDAVAERYAAEFGDELARKPLERGLLDTLAQRVREDHGADALIADVGSGPGHVARHLADRGARVVAVDPSERMLELARRRGVEGRAGHHEALPFSAGELAGVVAFYSLIHLDGPGRDAAFAELARVLRGGGWALVAFHVSTQGFPPGTVKRLEAWWDTVVDLDGHFLAPDAVLAGLVGAGFEPQLRLEREPWPGGEFPSRRCVLLLRRGRA